MATFVEMQTYVSKRVLDPNRTVVSLDDVKEGINDAIKFWKFRRFWFNEVSDTGVMTQGDPSFPYPSDFLVPATKDGGFVIEYGSVRYPMSKVSNLAYDGWYLNNGYGMPRWYARAGNQEYQAYPIPDRDYTVRRHYLKDYEDLDADADENDFTTYATRLIELEAIGNLIGEIREDMGAGSGYLAKADREFKNLLVMTNKSNAAGKLMLHSTLLNSN